MKREDLWKVSSSKKFTDKTLIEWASVGSGIILIRDSGHIDVYVVYVWVVYDCDSNETLKSILNTFSNTFFGAKFNWAR